MNNSKRLNENGYVCGLKWLAVAIGSATLGFAAYKGISILMEENPHVEVITTVEQAESACNKLRKLEMFH